MKIVLGVSLILNLVLGIWLLNQESRPPIERVVVEKHAEEKLPPVEELKTLEPLKSKKKTKKTTALGFEQFDPSDFTPDEFGEMALAPDAARKEFMTSDLNIPEEKLLKHEELRMEYFASTSKFTGQAPTGELSLKDRKEMLRLEEIYETKVRKLYGNENWERFEKYRQNYNADVIKRSRLDGTPPFLMMP